MGFSLSSVHYFAYYDAFIAYFGGTSPSANHPMTLVQLRHFIALADSASFLRAAEACSVTQPALSRSIQALEGELGGELFDRVGRKAELTALGRALLDRARRLVADAQEMETLGQRLLHGQGGQLRVGMSSGPAALLVTPLLSLAATQYPDVRVDVTRGTAEVLSQALLARKLDALVVDVRALPISQDFCVSHVAELPGEFLVRPEHPLLQQPAPLRFDQVMAYPIASTPLSDEIDRLLVERYGPQAHTRNSVRLRSEDVPGLEAVALASDAVVLAVARAAPKLRRLHLEPALRASGRFGLVTLDRRQTPPNLPMLTTVLRQVFELPPSEES